MDTPGTPPLPKMRPAPLRPRITTQRGPVWILIGAVLLLILVGGYGFNVWRQQRAAVQKTLPTAPEIKARTAPTRAPFPKSYAEAYGPAPSAAQRVRCSLTSPFG